MCPKSPGDAVNVPVLLRAHLAIKWTIYQGHLRVDQIPIDLGITINQVVSDVTASAPQRVINVGLDDALAVGDEQRALQVLNNGSSRRPTLRSTSRRNGSTTRWSCP